MISDFFSNLFDVQVNYIAVIVAAIVYFILTAIWYSSQVFGKELVRHEIVNTNRMPSKALAYVGEFIAALIIAYVLTVIIEFAGVGTPLEGLNIGFWMWLGFVLTTQFCDAIWGRKSFTSFVLNSILILVGFLVMGALIPVVRDAFPSYIF